MLLRYAVGLLLSVGAPALLAVTAYGQSYPNKPVRIVTSTPGDSADFASRLIGPAMSASMGEQFIVDNRSPVIQPQIVANASPDGYTLMVASSSFWVATLIRKTTFSPLRDFAPVSSLVAAPYLVVVPSSLPVNSIRELIDLAKAKPGSLNYGSGPAGGSNNLAAELFKSLAGVNITSVPYKGAEFAIVGLLNGEVQLLFNSAAVAPHIKSGRLRALGIANSRPSALFPDLPLVSATVPGYEFGSTYNMFAPAHTPTAIIDRLNREVVRALNQAEIKDQFLRVGSEIVGSSPEELGKMMKSEMDQLGKVIKDLGIRAN